jgi:hypothetical protein
MARKGSKSIIKPGPRADTTCAVCGRPLDLFTATTSLDGRTVCRSGCLGGMIVQCREHPAFQDDQPPCHQNDDTAPEGHHDD